MKNVFVLFVVLLLTVSFVACSKSKNESVETLKSSETQPKVDLEKPDAPKLTDPNLFDIDDLDDEIESFTIDDNPIVERDLPEEKDEKILPVDDELTTFEPDSIIEPEPFVDSEPAELVADLVDTIKYLDVANAETRKYWDSIYIGRRHVGFQSTEFSSKQIAGNPVLCIEVQNRITMMRLGVPTEVAVAVRSFESFSGKFLGCQSKKQMGTMLVDHSAKIVGDTLETVTEVGDKVVKQQFPWNSTNKIGGYSSIQISLFRKPMLAKEERKVTFYDPTNLTLVDAVLAAGEVEQIDILGQTVNLRKIEAILKYVQAPSATPIPFTLWADVAGNIIRSETPFVGEDRLISIRTDAIIAKDKIADDPTFDVAAMPIIPLAEPLVEPKAAKKYTFNVRGKRGAFTAMDLLKIFPNTAFQNVKQVDADTIQITVNTASGVDPEMLVGGMGMETAETTPKDLAPNTWITSDDSLVMEQAALAVPIDATVWEKAVALEKWVHGAMKTDYASGGFETAADIARKLRGGCTEYGFFLAALARSQEIPTRVVVGYAYTQLNTPNMEKNGAMTFHLWNEMFIDNHWIPVDATCGMGGADAARIKVADSDLDTTSFVSLTSRILQISGNLEMEVVE